MRKFSTSHVEGVQDRIEDGVRLSPVNVSRKSC